MFRMHGQRAGTLRSAATDLTALVSCALLAGCGNITAGGLRGDVTVTVSSDAPDAQVAASQRAAALAPTPFAVSGDGPEGEVRAAFFLYLETAAGSSVSLSEDEIRVRLDIQGRQEIDAVDRMPVTATQYTRMRIVFTDIRVEVADGLIINGEPVVGEVRVELKDTTLTVTRPLNLDVGDGESVFLLIDLNANAWLQAVDPVLKVIEEDVFGNAVSVGVQ